MPPTGGAFKDGCSSLLVVAPSLSVSRIQLCWLNPSSYLLAVLLMLASLLSVTGLLSAPLILHFQANPTRSRCSCSPSLSFSLQSSFTQSASLLTASLSFLFFFSYRSHQCHSPASLSCRSGYLHLAASCLLTVNPDSYLRQLQRETGLYMRQAYVRGVTSYHVHSLFSLIPSSSVCFFSDCLSSLDNNSQLPHLCRSVDHRCVTVSET